MKTKEQSYTRLGIFVFTGLAIFTAAIFYIGTTKNLFGENFRLSAYYKNVDGLMVGNNVRFSGINVGTVDGIVIVNDTTVQVMLLVSNDVRQFIKKDATANISSTGLMGDKVVNIFPGSPGQKCVDDGEVIRSVKPFSFDELIDPLRETLANMQAISSDVAHITGNIRSGKGTIGKLFRDEKLAGNISSTMKNVNSASEKLNENMEALKDNFLFRGHYKKKEKEELKKKEKEEKDIEKEEERVRKAEEHAQKDAEKQKKKEEREKRKKEKGRSGFLFW